MKRIFSILLIVLIMVFLVACGDGNEHIGEAKTPSGSRIQKGRNFEDVTKDFQEHGFSNIKYEKIEDIVFGLFKDDGEVEEVSVGGDFDYSSDAWVPSDSEVVIRYHTYVSNNNDETITETLDDSNKELEDLSVETEEKESKTLSYATADYKTAKNGNTGIYSYKKLGSGSYDIYFIIDFDEGNIYYFTHGNGEETCDRIKIDSGDLNSILIYTYHDGEYSWSEALYFKYVNQPDHLIFEDSNHFKWDYVPTNVNDAIALRDSKTIHDY